MGSRLNIVQGPLKRIQKKKKKPIKKKNTKKKKPLNTIVKTKKISKQNAIYRSSFD